MGNEERNVKIYEYESLLYDAEGSGGAYVIFPYDIRKEFGRGRVKVHAEFDGEPYDGRGVQGDTRPDWKTSGRRGQGDYQGTKLNLLFYCNAIHGFFQCNDFLFYVFYILRQCVMTLACS